jgi:hypothetical protein
LLQRTGYVPRGSGRERKIIGVRSRKLAVFEQVTSRR